MNLRRTALLASFSAFALGGLTFCGSSDDAVSQTGDGVGGAAAGHAGSAGKTNAGTSQAGAPSGGATQAGAPSGGSTQAGAPSGGSTEAGAPSGGATQAGAPSGGSTQAGAPSGGSTQAGAPSGGSTQAGAAGSDAVCANPQAQLIDGKDTGVDACDGNFLHRRAAAACPNDLPRPDVCMNPIESIDGACAQDKDCTAQPNGRCLLVPEGDFSGCGCTYDGCTTDADCGADELCACGQGLGSCIQAACHTDADCGAGADCVSVSHSACDGPITSFECSTTPAECANDQDCSKTGGVCKDAVWTKICDGGFGCPG